MYKVSWEPGLSQVDWGLQDKGASSEGTWRQHWTASGKLAAGRELCLRRLVREVSSPMAGGLWVRRGIQSHLLCPPSGSTLTPSRGTFPLSSVPDKGLLPSPDRSPGDF